METRIGMEQIIQIAGSNDDLYMLTNSGNVYLYSWNDGSLKIRKMPSIENAGKSFEDVGTGDWKEEKWKS